MSSSVRLIDVQLQPPASLVQEDGPPSRRDVTSGERFGILGRVTASNHPHEVSVGTSSSSQQSTSLIFDCTILDPLLEVLLVRKN
ncbi:hypothetical protein E2562_003734 [Oryza meyeriana var. granulata]|uniref:Uncharacterized protein n=1 Tax=Oryza meyeriana var. granulata TaxID=110450 RepID=A0A6G1BRB1_9ORYZ|nr:hypothetical protein E2562_003734 [Oryza meyeriana var. granulata]